MKAQREFTFHMPPVLYDVSGVGVQFSKAIVVGVMPDFSSSPIIIESAEKLGEHMRKCAQAASQAGSKHANDHVFYTDGQYIVAHRTMVLIHNPIKYKPNESLGFKSGLPHNVRF